MPETTEHLKQYKHNKSLMNLPPFDLKETKHPDWVITIAFYVAVHLIEKELADCNHHPPEHLVRNNFVRTLTQLRPISPHYHLLYNESIRARYRCQQISKKDAQVVVNALTEIEKKLLAKP